MEKTSTIHADAIACRRRAGTFLVRPMSLDERSRKLSWTHVVLIPHAIWPVLSLGTKRIKLFERTVDSETRYWPFVQEVTSLWSARLFITEELKDPNANVRETQQFISYYRREQIGPKDTLRIILLNIFHGATKDLETGWEKDRMELKEIARRNLMYGGSDWKTRLGVRSLDPESLVENLLLHDQNGLFLDGAQINEYVKDWSGIEEFLSGNQFDDIMTVLYPEVSDAFENQDRFSVHVPCVDEEYQLLRLRRMKSADPIFGCLYDSKSLWVLVKMVIRTSNRGSCSFGKMKWWKVVHGDNSSELKSALETNDKQIVRRVLRDQGELFGNVFWDLDTVIHVCQRNEKVYWKCENQAPRPPDSKVSQASHAPDTKVYDSPHPPDSKVSESSSALDKQLDSEILNSPSRSAVNATESESCFKACHIK